MTFGQRIHTLPFDPDYAGKRLDGSESSFLSVWVAREQIQWR
jgi:hypothetical protein